MNIRKPKNEQEKKLLIRFYKKGMRNGWASGRFAEMDGDFISEDDRLNLNSISFIDDINDLIEFFKMGNWCLGQGVIYKNLCFIQQINGGDEWLTLKLFDNDKIKDFESISMGRIIEDHGETFTRKYIKDLTKAIWFKKEYERVVFDDDGEIKRDSKGLALTEKATGESVSYGKYLNDEVILSVVAK